MDVCLRVLKESNKSRFDSYSVRNSVLIISHITFQDCRVHILSDNLSWNSRILVQFFRWPLCFSVQSFEVNFHTENMAARSGNGQGKNFFKVDEKSGNFTLNQGTVKSLKEFREIVRVHTVFILFPLLLLFSNISNFFVNFTEMESCCNGIYCSWTWMTRQCWLLKTINVFCTLYSRTINSCMLHMTCWK